MKAIWNGKIIAESQDTIQIEGNHYFPHSSVNIEYLKNSSTNTTCPWKGEASYYDIVVDGQLNKDAAWYYPNPKEDAKVLVKKDFSNYIAFWRGVEVI